MMWRWMTAAAAVLLVAGCGSSPKTSYFTLAPVPAQNASTAATTSPVMVSAVKIPRSLDRQSMVRRTGENTVDVDEQDRWAAPLGDMARRVLSEDLAMRLPKDKVVLPDSPVPPDTSRIVVAVSQFGPDGSGKIVLNGNWSLVKDGQDRPDLSHEINLETNAENSGAGDQAAGMSRLLGQLASEIATTLQAGG